MVKNEINGVAINNNIMLLKEHSKFSLITKLNDQFKLGHFLTFEL